MYLQLLGTSAVIYIFTLACILRQKKKKEKIKKWAKKWHLRRNEGRGILNMLNKELLVEDPAAYRNYLRLNNSQFETLLKFVEPLIQKQDTLMRECIPARSRLEITLRFLASGDTYTSLMYSSRIHVSTISRIIPEVCDAIVQTLRNDYLKTPTRSEAWEKIANDFNVVWQFPQCIGALDGRHITFRPPRSAGSFYYNYKGDHSLVLLAMADAFYRFAYVNVGVNGRISDGGVFRESGLSKALFNNSLNLPLSKSLTKGKPIVPYVIIADDAFPLSTTRENKLFVNTK